MTAESKWTQEEWDAAAFEAEKAYLAIPKDQGWPAQRMKDAATEFICQRTALLEALKAIVSIQGASYSVREREQALAAIAKAEGK
jgi:hypothetical protein